MGNMHEKRYKKLNFYHFFHRHCLPQEKEAAASAQPRASSDGMHYGAGVSGNVPLGSASTSVLPSLPGHAPPSGYLPPLPPPPSLPPLPPGAPLGHMQMLPPPPGPPPNTMRYAPPSHMRAPPPSTAPSSAPPGKQIYFLLSPLQQFVINSFY
jgi:hypothetical protein